ncbi:unnamed protein product [Camellia sinensis]
MGLRIFPDVSSRVGGAKAPHDPVLTGVRGPAPAETPRDSFIYGSILTLCERRRLHGCPGHLWVMVFDFSMPEDRAPPNTGSCSKDRLVEHGFWGNAFYVRYGGTFLRTLPQHPQSVCGLRIGSLSRM